MIDTIRWQPDGDTPLPGRVRMIDQTLLPGTLQYLETNRLEVVYDAIQRLVVRGAPAIGIAGAFGLTAGMQARADTTATEFLVELRRQADYLAAARPTAVNLSWAVRRCTQRVAAAASAGEGVPALKRILWEEADSILREDIDMCRRIGEHGVTLFHPNMGVMTHCNAGALATGDFGTALSPIYVAQERGLQPRVYANETRPLLQGARLTAWELQRAGVTVTTQCDNAAAYLMSEGNIELVIVGADRIAANGDTANKIGTYGVAVLAAYHGIPFYVAAPYSTIDPAIAHGSGIPIEERDGAEVGCGFGIRTAPEGVSLRNPAFDVTPYGLVAGIITDRGILRPPYRRSIQQLLAG